MLDCAITELRHAIPQSVAVTGRYFGHPARQTASHGADSAAGPRGGFHDCCSMCVGCGRVVDDQHARCPGRDEYRVISSWHHHRRPTIRPAKGQCAKKAALYLGCSRNQSQAWRIYRIGAAFEVRRSLLVRGRKFRGAGSGGGFRHLGRNCHVIAPTTIRCCGQDYRTSPRMSISPRLRAPHVG